MNADWTSLVERWSVWANRTRASRFGTTSCCRHFVKRAAAGASFLHREVSSQPGLHQLEPCATTCGSAWANIRSSTQIFCPRWQRSTQGSALLPYFVWCKCGPRYISYWDPQSGFLRMLCWCVLISTSLCFGGVVQLTFCWLQKFRTVDSWPRLPPSPSVSHGLWWIDKQSSGVWSPMLGPMEELRMKRSVPCSWRPQTLGRWLCLDDRCWSPLYFCVEFWDMGREGLLGR